MGLVIENFQQSTTFYFYDMENLDKEMIACAFLL